MLMIKLLTEKLIFSSFQPPHIDFFQEIYLITELMQSTLILLKDSVLSTHSGRWSCNRESIKLMHKRCLESITWPSKPLERPVLTVKSLKLIGSKMVSLNGWVVSSLHYHYLLFLSGVSLANLSPMSAIMNQLQQKWAFSALVTKRLKWSDEY